MSANPIHAETTGVASMVLMDTSVCAPEVSWAITVRQTLMSAHPTPVFMGGTLTLLSCDNVNFKLGD